MFCEKLDIQVLLIGNTEEEIGGNGSFIFSKITGNVVYNHFKVFDVITQTCKLCEMIQKLIFTENVTSR